MFVLFSKDNCPQCIQVEGLMKLKGKEFTTKKLDKDYTREDLEIMFVDHMICPPPRSFPMVFKDGVYIGSINDVKTLMVKGQL